MQLMTGIKPGKKTSAKLLKGTCGIFEKRWTQGDCFSFASCAHPFAQRDRWKQMEADNKKGA